MLVIKLIVYVHNNELVGECENQFDSLCHCLSFVFNPSANTKVRRFIQYAGIFPTHNLDISDIPVYIGTIMQIILVRFLFNRVKYNDVLLCVNIDLQGYIDR